MTADIVERLRQFSLGHSFSLHRQPQASMADEAADEIERLLAANDDLELRAKALDKHAAQLEAGIELLIALLAKARGPEGETEERVAEWLRGRGYACAKP